MNVIFFTTQSCTEFIVDGTTPVRCEYVVCLDRVIFTSGSAIGARRELNGVLLLESALQLPVQSPEEIIRVELPLPDVSSLSLSFALLATCFYSSVSFLCIA